MGLYRRVAKSKKGMSTIFGALFFVILILMGFNVMLWGFVQWDAYNRVIANMSQRDQQALSENLVPTNSTCSNNCKLFGTEPLNIWVNNLGGGSVSVVSVYISNVNGTGICQPVPCILTPISGTGNIPAGSVNFPVKVQGIVIGSNSYRITLATLRGRLFSLYYPWRFNSLIINQNGGGGNFVTNIGPLAIYFDYKSFNYTIGSSGPCSGVAPNPSCPAFCMPTGPVILYIRVANTADSDVTILTQTGLEAQAYGVNGFGQFTQGWLLDPNSINPGFNSAYTLAGPGANPYVLKAAGPSGPTPQSFAVLKIGAPNPGSAGSITWTNAGRTWITFIGIYYLFKGNPQGQTVPFMDFFTNSPNCIV